VSAIASELTGLRTTLRDVCSEATGLPFLEGLVDGPVHNRALGCVYPVNIAEDSENVLIARIRMNIRVYQKWIEQTDPERPVSSQKLEEWADQLRVALSDNQLSGGVWFFRLLNVEFDLEDQGIELSILAFADNMFGCPAP
jgi:hypothetical protein